MWRKKLYVTSSYFKIEAQIKKVFTQHWFCTEADISNKINVVNFTFGCSRIYLFYLKSKVRMVGVKKPVHKHQGDIDKNEESKTLNCLHCSGQYFCSCDHWVVLVLGVHNPRAYGTKQTKLLVEKIFVHSQQAMQGYMAKKQIASPTIFANAENRVVPFNQQI